MMEWLGTIVEVYLRHLLRVMRKHDLTNKKQMAIIE